MDVAVTFENRRFGQPVRASDGEGAGLTGARRQRNGAQEQGFPHQRSVRYWRPRRKARTSTFGRSQAQSMSPWRETRFALFTSCADRQNVGAPGPPCRRRHFRSRRPFLPEAMHRGYRRPGAEPAVDRIAHAHQPVELCRLSASNRARGPSASGRRSSSRIPAFGRSMTVAPCLLPPLGVQPRSSQSYRPTRRNSRIRTCCSITRDAAYDHHATQ